LAETPLVIAHRGASAELPDNSLAAFAMAAEQGADGIELDVQFSADGHLVIYHDFTLERLTGNKQKVSDLTLAELKDLELGDEQTVPTLEELFEMMGPRFLYNIELKDFGWRDKGLETAVADRVESFGLENLALISSFHRSIPVALIRAKGAFKYGYWLASGAADHPHYSLVNKEYMVWARKRNYRVHVWTVDDPAEASRLVQLGVHGVITNKPQFIRQHLQ
jgi:glycerophosphoryl diester phosphodiesterase